MNDRVAAWVAPSLLVLSGLGLVVGGLLHPRVPDAEEAQLVTIASDPAWPPVHWVITLAQALAVPAVALAASEAAAARRLPPLAAGGVAAILAGMVFGTLGTLASATGVRAAAEAGDLPLFRTLNHLDLGVGWMCVVLTTLGGVLVGFAILREARGRWVRACGAAVAAGSTVFLIGAAVLPPPHPWTHQWLLRLACLAWGLALLAAGVVRARFPPAPPLR